MCELIASEARRFKYLLNSDRLDDDEKKLYRDLISLQEGRETVLAVKLKFSLKKISELLYKHYNQKKTLKQNVPTVFWRLGRAF